MKVLVAANQGSVETGLSAGPLVELRGRLFRVLGTRAMGPQLTELDLQPWDPADGGRE